MESFPEELLISIFSHLKSQDLIAISLTCKRFSEIINYSSQLISLLTVKFSKESSNLEWIGSRKYSNVLIIEGGVEQFLEIYKICGFSVKKLAISIKDLQLFELIEVLNLCPNLKELEITEKSPDDANFNKNQLPCLNLNKIKVTGGLKSLKVLENCQTKELQVCWRPRLYPSVCPLADFLVNQNNLKILNLENFSEYSFDFPQNLIDKVQFRLEKLAVRNCSDLYILKLKNFLDLHINSMKYLELDSYGHRESKLLQPFSNLKTLKFNAECLKIHGPMSPTDMIFSILSSANQFPDPFYFKVLPLFQIEILKVFNVDSDFVQFSNYFPNVKELIIDGRQNSFFIDVEKFNKVESLEIYAKTLTKCFKIPMKLKKLKFSVENFPKIEEPIAGYAESKIEELIFEGNCDLNLIKNLVSNGCKNLKVFKTLNKEEF